MAPGCRMLRLYPAADVPVAQISIQPSLNAEHHLRIGAALAPLAPDGVLILGSGHLTHNLREWIADARRRGSMSIDERDPEQYVSEFLRLGRQRPALGRPRQRWPAGSQQAPHARRAHPTPEHFLPLMIAVGAAGPAPMVEHIEAGVDSGVLAMDAYLFWPR